MIKERSCPYGNSFFLFNDLMDFLLRSDDFPWVILRFHFNDQMVTL